MKIIGLNIVVLILSLSALTQARIKKSVRSSRKLNEEEEDMNIPDENPDLELLEDLEEEMEHGEDGNIFKELMEQKQEMLDKLKLLEGMVNEDLALHDDENDPLNKNDASYEEEHGHHHDPNQHHENWLIVHRHKLIKFAILIIIFALIVLIGWKLSKISADLVEKKNAVKLFQKNLEKIDEKGIDSLVANWKDQREGISK